MRPSSKMALSLWLGAGAAAVALSLVAGCEAGEGSRADKRGEGDVKVGTIDYGKPHIVNNADDYPNVSIKCDGKYGLLIVTPRHWKNDVPVTVLTDPRCPGYDSRTKVGPPPTGTNTPPEDGD